MNSLATFALILLAPNAASAFEIDRGDLPPALVRTIEGEDIEGNVMAQNYGPSLLDWIFRTRLLQLHGPEPNRSPHRRQRVTFAA